MSGDPITRNWPAWVTDLDDLIKRAVNQHSDMRCCCSVDDDCYIGLLLDEVERLRVLSDSDRAVLAEAFLAGFMASGEGWNGEWTPKGTDLNVELAKPFQAWLAARRAVQEGLVPIELTPERRAALGLDGGQEADRGR